MAKVAIFVFGLLIVCLATWWLVPWVPGTAENRAFIAADVVVLYLVTFAPLVLESRLSQATTGRLVSMGVRFWGIGLYAAYSVVLMVLACTSLYLATRLLVILQLVGLFVLVGVLYSSVAAHDHADEVEVSQDTLMRSIEHIRSMASAVAIDASTLDDGYADATRKVESICEEVRYLSPVTDDRAYDLEDQIYGLLGELSGLVHGAMSGSVTADELSRKADDVLLLVRQRKALIN